MAHTLMANNARIVIHPVSSVQALDLSSAQGAKLENSSIPHQQIVQPKVSANLRNVIANSFKLSLLR